MNFDIKHKIKAKKEMIDQLSVEILALKGSFVDLTHDLATKISIKANKLKSLKEELKSLEKALTNAQNNDRELE